MHKCTYITMVREVWMSAFQSEFGGNSRTAVLSGPLRLLKVRSTPVSVIIMSVYDECVQD